MDNWNIKVILTDGEKNVESILYYEHYLLKKEIKGTSLLDEAIEKLANRFSNGEVDGHETNEDEDEE